MTPHMIRPFIIAPAALCGLAMDVSLGLQLGDAGHPILWYLCRLIATALQWGGKTGLKERPDDSVVREGGLRERPDGGVVVRRGVEGES